MRRAYRCSSDCVREGPYREPILVSRANHLCELFFESRGITSCLGYTAQH